MKYKRLLRLFASLLLFATAPLHAGMPSEKLAPALQPFVDRKALAGAVVLVADPEEVLDVEAVGYADVAAKKPMQKNAMFWIASQSKPITAVALMILVDEGKVNVDDPVEKYLPEFRGQMVNVSADPTKPELVLPRHPILVREVLSHTSGLDFKSPMETPTLDLKPLGERVSSYAKMALLFQPGSRSKYSNAGLNVAGRIIEVVSGVSYETFLEECLFKPLGMSDTTFWPNQEQQTRLAKSYKPNATKDGLEEIPIGQLLYPLESRDRFPMPAGGLFSTANDLSLFYRMMANGGTFHGTRVLSKKAVEMATSDQSGEAQSNYGFGFGTNGKTFTHGGAYGTNSRYDREHKLITVFLVQHAGWSEEGKKILPTFQKTATAIFGIQGKENATPLTIGINSAPASELQPKAANQ